MSVWWVLLQVLQVKRSYQEVLNAPPPPPHLRRRRVVAQVCQLRRRLFLRRLEGRLVGREGLVPLAQLPLARLVVLWRLF